jgi:hypothetical protein
MFCSLKPTAHRNGALSLLTYRRCCNSLGQGKPDALRAPREIDVGVNQAAVPGRR